jgi:succinyl-CoA synthetase beta subunit
VRKLWVEHASDIATEYYASVLLDRSAKQPLVMFSTEGGVDIEEVAERTPEKLVRHHVDSLRGLSREEAVEIATRGGADADVVDGVADALVALYEVWIQERRSRWTATPSTATPTTKASPTRRTKTRSSAAPRSRVCSTSRSTATSASSATARAS